MSSRLPKIVKKNFFFKIVLVEKLLKACIGLLYYRS